MSHASRTLSRMNQERWTPKTTVRSLASGTLIDALTHAQLLVYLKILAASARYRTKTLEIKNDDIKVFDARTIRRVLKDLDAFKLIKIDYSRLGRTIEVL